MAAARKSPADDDDTLHLPRILCLHGGGTNATIFHAQCRVLERVLKPTFRLCFAEAPFPSEPGPDVVSVYREFGPFRAWLGGQHDDQSLAGAIEASLQSAMAEDDGKGATGPWVALLGFSQGAKICASLLYHQQQLHTDSTFMVSGSEPEGPNTSASNGRSERRSQGARLPHFRFAVLLAGRGPIVSLTPDLPPTPESSRPRHGGDGPGAAIERGGPGWPLLSLPTIHVHGLADPGLALHRQLLAEYCDQRSAQLIEWDGDHRVPIKTKDVTAVVEAILCMARDTGVFAMKG